MFVGVCKEQYPKMDICKRFLGGIEECVRKLRGVGKLFFLVLWLLCGWLVFHND